MPAAIAYLALLGAGIYWLPRGRKLLAPTLGAVCVIIWWLTLQPSNERAWQPDVARTASATVDGDFVTIRNFRNFDYRTETDFTERWETRIFDLNRLVAADIFITFWGSPWIAHPIISFAFDDGQHVAFSIETRKEVGETYSALRGFFRQYELIYIAADERDLIRLRTNYRVGEEVYLYRTTASAAEARRVFLDYLKSMNALHEAPAFYNAITSNCTTNIRIHTAAAERAALPAWDWRLLLNGKGDEYAYEHGRLAGDLPFAELKLQAHINDAARAADQAADFSRQIRLGRAGF
ncbi:MAG: DUF4105 domain-containing protein [Rhodospirillaceae bacterium]|nr:DUF4105 domain-containing protein [Rhodospirillaceae bacterium]